MIPGRRSSSRHVLSLRVGRATLQAQVVDRAAVVWAAEASYTNPADLAEALARLAAEAPPGVQRLRVTLERPPAQVRTLTGLPAVTPSDLRALVAHQASRFFRRNGEPVVTDAAWVAHGAGRVARAAAVAEPVVEAIATGARAAGLMLDRITPADETEPLVLLPQSERVGRERAGRRRLRVLVGATAGVWLAAAALFVMRLLGERRAVDRELVALAQPLAAVRAARRELGEAAATVDAIAAAERRRGESLTALGRIAHALPDSAVLTSLVWADDGSGVLSGAARQAAPVVAALERAGVPAPRLDGPVLRAPIGGHEWERFTIGFGREPGRGGGDWP